MPSIICNKNPPSHLSFSCRPCIRSYMETLTSEIGKKRPLNPQKLRGIYNSFYFLSSILICNIIRYFTSFSILSLYCGLRYKSYDTSIGISYDLRSISIAKGLIPELHKATSKIHRNKALIIKEIRVLPILPWERCCTA